MNDMAPLISIITATFNSERYLEDTIRSVIGQSYPGVEYIIVDGGSTDHTLDIVTKYRNQISKIISEPDKGIYDAFNKGLKIASGDVIYFLNSDDYLYDKDVIADVAALFAENPDYRFIYGNVLVLDEKVNYQYICGKHFTCEDLKTGDMPPHQGFFVNRELIAKVGLFNTRYQISGDFDFIIRCFKAAGARANYFNRTIAVFGEGGVSTDTEKRQLMNVERQQIVKRYFDCDQVPNLQLQEVNGLYKVWLECLLLGNKGITHCLHDCQLKNVAIYGTMKTALYLCRDLKQEGFIIICFLDNNRNMQGQFIEGIPVYPPEWLGMNQAKLDVIISSIEGGHDLKIVEQLKGMITNFTNHRVKICTWKDLARGILSW